MSRVAIVGPGRVGTLLALALTRAGYRVVAAAGGSAPSRERLAGLVAGVRTVDHPAEAAERAELLLVAVPDDAIDQVVTELVVAGAVGEQHRVVHVAGSRGLGALRRAGMAGARIAACHPAMTVPEGAADPDVLVGAAWAVTARAADRGWAHELVTDLGGDPVDVPDDRRALYHAGLTVGSNAVGAAVATARRLLLAARIEDPGAFLRPLISASVDNVLSSGADALTGPIVRGDIGTVTAHLAVLDRDLPELAEAYRALGRATLVAVRASLGPDTVERLLQVLAEPTPPGAEPDTFGAPALPPGSSSGSSSGEGPSTDPPPAVDVPPGRELPVHPDT